MSASPAAGATPLADTVLGDPLRVPPGLAVLLRAIEGEARAEYTRLAALNRRDDVVAAVRSCAAQLEQFLEDELRSPFLRALRRPLRQIAPGTQGARTLQRSHRSLVERARRASELQASVDALRDAVRQVHDRFGTELPRATRVVLSRFPLAEAEVKMRRARDAEGARGSLRDAERELERLALHLPVSDAALEPGAKWYEEIARGELLAFMELRLQGRRQLVREGGRASAVRNLTARHLQRLGSLAPAGRSAHAHTQVFAEQTAGAMLNGTLEAHDGEDLPLMCELLASATDALHDPARASAWVPQLPAPAPEPDRDTGATRFVVALDNTYALITPGVRSCVRVKDRGVRMDQRVDCTTFTAEGEPATLALAALDVEPLFAGLGREPAWYTTERTAQLQVIARFGDGWIARVTRKGSLRRSATPAWVEEPRDRARLRVLGTLTSPLLQGSVAVGASDADDRIFCGLATASVASPFVEWSHGWLRAPDGTAWGEAAIRAEEGLFRAVARHAPFVVPRAAGRGHCVERGIAGLLYVPPLGLHPGESPPLRNSLRENDGQYMLAAAARLWLLLREAGYALGVYHMDALAFRTGWSGGRGEPTLDAVVTDAPFAAPLGRYHARTPPDEVRTPAFARLGCRVLPPALAAGGVALPETEAQGFALLALDTMSMKPVPVHGVIQAEALAVILRERLDSFADPERAGMLVDSLLSRDAAKAVIGWIETLGGSPGPSHSAGAAP